MRVIRIAPLQGLKISSVRNPGLEAELLHPGLVYDALSGLIRDANLHIVHNVGGFLLQLRKMLTMFNPFELFRAI